MMAGKLRVLSAAVVAAALMAGPAEAAKHSKKRRQCLKPILRKFGRRSTDGQANTAAQTLIRISVFNSCETKICVEEISAKKSTNNGLTALLSSLRFWPLAAMRSCAAHVCL